MRTIFAFAAALMVSAAMTYPAGAQVFNVDTESNLRSALVASQLVADDDVINVAPGTYAVTSPFVHTPTTNFTLIINGAGADKTIFDGGNVSQIFRVNTTGLASDPSAGVTMRGITFTDGNSITGGGLLIQTTAADIKVEDCIFSSNAASSGGGGLFAQTVDGAILLRNNILSGNSSATNGGAAGVRITGASGTATMTNNTLSGTNTAARGGGLYVFLNENSSSTDIFNNIIFGNSAATGTDIFLDDDGNGDDAGAAVRVFYNDFSGLSSACIITPPCIPVITEGNNINRPPLLTSDYHLATGSPAIEAGTNTAPSLPILDIDGDPRAIDGNGDGSAITDMGADEFVPTTPVPPPPPPDEENGDTACFIATAAYGSSMAEEVAVLRRLRDRHLQTNPAGRALVRIYYAYSPPAAEFIANHGALRAAARLALAPVVYGAKYPWAALALIGFLAAIALAGKRKHSI